MAPVPEKCLQHTSSDPAVRIASLDDKLAVNEIPLVASIYELAPAVSSHHSSSCPEATHMSTETKPEPSAGVPAAARPAQPAHELETAPAVETPTNRLDKGPPQPPKQVVTETLKPFPSKGTEDRPAAAENDDKDPNRPPREGSARAVMTKSLRSLMSSKVGQLFLRSVDRALDKSEELMNRYLPVTEKELAALTMKGLDASAVKRHKKGCLVRLGSLSTSLRNRAFMLILNKLRLTRQNTHENLSQLHQTIDLIEHIQQDRQLRGSQQKLCSKGELWKQKQERDWGLHGSTDHPTASSSKDNGSTQRGVESKTLETSRSLTQQLQATYLNLLANIKDLPVHLQEKMLHVHENMAELHRCFSSASSVQDLSSSVLNQSRGKVAKAWEALDEVMEFVLQNPPVTWLVESLVSLEGELLETGEKPDILEVLQHYEPQDCKED